MNVFHQIDNEFGVAEVNRLCQIQLDAFYWAEKIPQHKLKETEREMDRLLEYTDDVVGTYGSAKPESSDHEADSIAWEVYAARSIAIGSRIRIINAQLSVLDEEGR